MTSRLMSRDYENVFTGRFVMHQTRKTVFEHVSRHQELKSVDNTRRTWVFLRNFVVFANVVKHCLVFFRYIFLVEFKTEEKGEIKSSKALLIKIRYINTVTVMIPVF